LNGTVGHTGTAIASQRFVSARGNAWGECDRYFEQ